ncbi:MAG: hypothetical protein KDA41_06305, partial [Planctomycetales bacterium]|nr:hypothetical protein [Planctomycetales bacterium]
HADKQKIAQEMLASADRVKADAVGRFALLTTAYRIALESNDIETASKSLDSLEREYELDVYDMKMSLLKKTSSLTQKNTFDTRLMDDSRRIAQDAVKRDDYKAALDMADVALAAARRLNDRKAVIAISKAARDLQKMSRAYDALNARLAELGGGAEDPKTSELAGRYYCLLKQEWDKGLPYLARAADNDLRRLAQRDVEAPTDPMVQLELADGWFDASARESDPEQESMERRALLWYDAALKSLPAGLAKLKAEQQAKDLRRELGGQRS